MALYTDLGREDLLDIIQNVTPDNSPLVNLMRSSTPTGTRHRWANRRIDYIEDNHGMCMCYKHRRIWREGADFKLGRRPRIGPGGACKECVLKTTI